MHLFVNYDFDLPKELALLISGVPGVGKTTISYEILKAFEEFRIIEETDIMRETLLGYNNYLRNILSNDIYLLNRIDITDHTKLLSFADAVEQCKIMTNSISKIIERQRRKKIPIIINGVHIIPEILCSVLESESLVYINLYVNNESVLRSRLEARDSNSYMLDHVSFIFESNSDLFDSTHKLTEAFPNKVFNIDVSELSVSETLSEVEKCLARRFISLQWEAK